AVVWGFRDDRVTRPAVGAVDERVSEAAVSGVEQLFQAVGADIAIRRNQRASAAPAAQGDAEAPFGVYWDIGGDDRGNKGKGRRFRLQGRYKGVQRGSFPLCLDQNAF